MRRAILLPALALALAVTSCNSGSTTAQRTTTVVHTVTGGTAGGSAAGPPSSVVVAAPSSTPSPVSTSRSTSAAPTPKKTTAPPKPTATSAPPIVKVDPLASDCSSLLDPSDVKKAIGATVGAGSSRKKDVANPLRGITGKIRCYYPKADAKGTAPVVIALTQYATAAAAAKQVKTTVGTETDAGATATAPKVNGYPAHLLLRSGALVVVQYGTWTLAIATADRLAGNAAVTAGLPALAGQVLTRVLKNA